MTDQPAERPRERIVDGTAAMEREFTEGLVERNAERWERRKRGIDADRRAARAELTALKLHREIEQRATRLSTVPASGVAPSRGGGDPQILIGSQQLVEDDPRWTEAQFIIRRRLEQLADLLDEYEGLGSQAQAAASMDTYDKNARVLKEGRGHPCDVVVDLLGKEIAGSPRTVWRIRKRTQDPGSGEHRILGHAVSTIDGQPVEARASQTIPADVRRVVIDGER